jgi:hypothetical protein
LYCDKINSALTVRSNSNVKKTEKIILKKPEVGKRWLVCGLVRFKDSIWKDLMVGKA